MVGEVLRGHPPSPGLVRHQDGRHADDVSQNRKPVGKIDRINDRSRMGSIKKELKMGWIFLIPSTN